MIDPELIKEQRDSIKDLHDISLFQMEMYKGPRFHSDKDLVWILKQRGKLNGKDTNPEDIRSVLIFLAQKDWHFKNKSWD